MPKDAFTLSDVREPTLTVVCLPCGRRGRYSVAKLIAKHGDAKILYVLAELTNCPKVQHDVYVNGVADRLWEIEYGRVVHENMGEAFG
jgi:hypothetical protein